MLAVLEVMDKEISPNAVLALAFLPTVCSFVAARKWPWLLLLVLPVAALFNFAHLSEVADPSIGHAMQQEGGRSYILLSWLSPVLTIASIIAGFYLRNRSSRAA